MITLDGKSLRIHDVVDVATSHRPVALAGDARTKMEDCRAQVKAYVESGNPAYGISTGFGALCTTSIAVDALRDLQVNLVRSHASGVGDYFPEDVVRGAMLLRANNLARGQSGARPVLVDTILALLNTGVTPAVRQKGSLGASGDLAPLADLALVLIGEGQAFYRGRLMDGAEALALAGVPPVELEAKEGLALLNGTAFMTSLAALASFRARNLLDALTKAAALSLVAFRGHTDAYSRALVEARPHRGAVRVAEQLRHLLHPDTLPPIAPNEKIQDPYSFRCVPQVHGAALDALDHAWEVVEVELNSTTDNPLVLEGRVVSGGNFHGQPIGVVMDYLAIALTAAAGISERRVNQLLHPYQSKLPAFLARDPGLNSGLMIAQYTAASLINESRILSTPASVQSLPVSADQEDHVSMATLAASKALTVTENSISVVAIELLTAAQALDLRLELGALDGAHLPCMGGDGVMAVYREIREHVPFIERDRTLTPLIEELSSLIRNGTLRC